MNATTTTLRIARGSGIGAGILARARGLGASTLSRDAGSEGTTRLRIARGSGRGPRGASMSTNALQNPGELVTIVNEDNEAIDTKTRAEMRAGNLIHRCSYVLILNKSGEIYTQKRVDFKETYPSFYDPAPGGVVGVESYEENALREIEEEMGVRNPGEFKKILDFYYSDSITRVFGRLFSCVYEGPFVLQETEVASAEFMSIDRVKELIEQGIVCPDSAMAIREHYKF